MSDDNTHTNLSSYRIVECSECHEPELFGNMFADRRTDENAWMCKDCTFGGMLEY
jgi:hypothetical protein